MFLAETFRIKTSNLKLVLITALLHVRSQWRNFEFAIIPVSSRANDPMNKHDQTDEVSRRSRRSLRKLFYNDLDVIRRLVGFLRQVTLEVSSVYRLFIFKKYIYMIER